MKNIGNIIGNTAIVAITVLSIRSCVLKNKEEALIKQDPLVVSGVFGKVNGLSRGAGYMGYCTYEVGGIRYEMAESLPSRQFFGHRFPVVYYRQDPSVARVLIHPDEFREFGFVFPDSLQYVKAWLP